MRVRQRRRAFKMAVTLLGLAGAPSVQAGESDGPQPQPLFVCGTDEIADRGFLELTGTETEPASWSALLFTRTADETGELRYAFPVDPGRDKTPFLFSHSDGPEGYLVTVKWEDAGDHFTLYSLAIPPGPDDAGGSDAGLVISRADEVIERVGCIERPYMFISYMREAMSCDLANPQGEKGCAELAPDRTAPLSEIVPFR